MLIVGAGALGAPAALYLSGAGVGCVGIMDADEVSLSNLHRQITHTADRIGRNKAESAKQAMLALNDRIRVRTYAEYLTPENADEIIRGYDFVIDAADNFETKFLINDACVLAGVPFCHAGILQFEGQIMTWVPGEQSCYRCIFEEIPESGLIPNCSQAGVIGALAGIVGSIQALEAVKYLLGIGELLTGRMMVFDGLTMKTRIAGFGRKNPVCRVCGSEEKLKSAGKVKSRSVKENAEEYRVEACTVFGGGSEAAAERSREMGRTYHADDNI